MTCLIACSRTLVGSHLGARVRGWLVFVDKLRSRLEAACCESSERPQEGRAYMGFSCVCSGGGGLSLVDQPQPMEGVIYGIRYGTLRWFRDLRRDGKNGPDGFAGWASSSGAQIHPDWEDMRLACSTGDGRI